MSLKKIKSKTSFLSPKRTKFNEKLELGHDHRVPKAPSEGETFQKSNTFLPN